MRAFGFAKPRHTRAAKGHAGPGQRRQRAKAAKPAKGKGDKAGKGQMRQRAKPANGPVCKGPSVFVKPRGRPRRGQAGLAQRLISC